MLSVDAALFIRLPRHCCSVCTLTDLSVGCMAQPLFVIHRIAALTRNYHIYCIAGIASNFAGSSVVVASFVTTTVIAVERYLALRLRLRYREFVTLKRVNGFIRKLANVGILVSPLVLGQKSARHFKNCTV